MRSSGDLVVASCVRCVASPRLLQLTLPMGRMKRGSRGSGAPGVSSWVGPDRWGFCVFVLADFQVLGLRTGRSQFLHRWYGRC